MLLLSLILVPLFGTLITFVFYTGKSEINENTLKISALIITMLDLFISLINKPISLLQNFHKKFILGLNLWLFDLFDLTIFAIFLPNFLCFTLILSPNLFFIFLTFIFLIIKIMFSTVGLFLMLLIFIFIYFIIYTSSFVLNLSFMLNIYLFNYMKRDTTTSIAIIMSFLLFFAFLLYVLLCISNFYVIINKCFMDGTVFMTGRATGDISDPNNSNQGGPSNPNKRPNTEMEGGSLEEENRRKRLREKQYNVLPPQSSFNLRNDSIVAPQPSINLTNDYIIGDARLKLAPISNQTLGSITPAVLPEAIYAHSRPLLEQEIKDIIPNISLPKAWINHPNVKPMLCHQITQGKDLLTFVNDFGSKDNLEALCKGTELETCSIIRLWTKRWAIDLTSIEHTHLVRERREGVSIPSLGLWPDYIVTNKCNIIEKLENNRVFIETYTNEKPPKK